MTILLTAGPTREPIDPVRFISNRSSGKMGYALAEAAADAGHEVILVSGPVAVSISKRNRRKVKLVPVETAQQMYEAVRTSISRVEAAVMTAAVADYRPARCLDHKIKKTEQSELPVIELEETKDILGSARPVFGFTGLLVGFAAETRNLEQYARDKLRRKQCDLIAANDVSRSDVGFDTDENEMTLFFGDGRIAPMGKAPKSALARHLIRVIETMTQAKPTR